MGECVAFPTEIGGDDSPLIPEGKYEMAYASHHTWIFMGRQPKVVIRFCVIDPGEYFGVIIPAYYNVQRTIGKRQRNGRFKASKRSNLVRDFYRVFPKEPLVRLDRLPLTKLNTTTVIATVHTVTRDFTQRDLPEVIQYSIVKSIDR
jgi:hypothetical protein